jgi:SAM-dependent methyltransferase
MSDLTAVFDLPHAERLAEAKKRVFHSFLPDLIREADLRTAIDIGCGFGYFTKYLKDLGLEVSAFDARIENAQETAKRNPDCKVWVDDIESLSTNPGSFDLVLCLGLLYHLENPFLALRHLYSLTEKIAIIETMVAPFVLPVTVLIEEPEGQDQSLRYVAQIPSQSWLLKVLSKVGFPFIYELKGRPRHSDFHAGLFVERRRIILVASKLPLHQSCLREVTVPPVTNRWMWYRWGISRLLEHQCIRGILRRIAARERQRRQKNSC